MSKRPKKAASSAMAQAAMPLAELEQWLIARRDRHPAATSLPMFDGYIAAIVAGPASLSPLDWICPLLAIDADAFNHGGTPEFAAISATAVRHNEISDTLSTRPEQFVPLHARKPDGDIDPGPWCEGFYAAMHLSMWAWHPLLNPTNANHRLLRPILLHCRDNHGRPRLAPLQGSRTPRLGPFIPDLEIPAAVEALRQYWIPIRYASGR